MALVTRAIAVVLTETQANNGLVTGRKTMTRTTRSQVGEGSWGGYEAEEFNNWRRRKPAAVATGPLENCT
jgi:hypothetical protein